MQLPQRGELRQGPAGPLSLRASLLEATTAIPDRCELGLQAFLLQAILCFQG